MTLPDSSPGGRPMMPDTIRAAIRHSWRAEDRGEPCSGCQAEAELDRLVAEIDRLTSERDALQLIVRADTDHLRKLLQP